MTELRDYQLNAVYSTRNAWRSCRSVLLCAPTGSGKTEMGRELLSGFQYPVWLCDKRDLGSQARDRVPCTVDSIQKAAKRAPNNMVDLAVLDEAHHATADTWKEAVTRFPNAKLLGLTATPERGDGTPLGDVFKSLVVAASFSELIAAGHVLPCRVFRPSKDIEHGLACSPVGAYLKYAAGKSGFCYVSSLAQAETVKAEFIAAGVRCQVVHGKTKKDERDWAMVNLTDGTINLIINCATMHEGINIPRAEVCILARRCQHAGIYIQTTGRVLRPYPGKTHGMLLDLVGASLRHGLPTEDRTYSLTGTAIARAKVPSLRQCCVCGAVMMSHCRECISCHTVFVPGVHKPPRIFDMELKEVYNGSETEDKYKVRELAKLCGRKRWAAAAKRFEELFGRRPTQDEWSRIDPKPERAALLKRFPPGQVSAIMKQYTGKWSFEQ